MCVGVQLRADVKRQEAAQELGNVEGYRKKNITDRQSCVIVNFDSSSFGGSMEELQLQVNFAAADLAFYLLISACNLVMVMPSPKHKTTLLRSGGPCKPLVCLSVHPDHKY